MVSVNIFSNMFIYYLFLSSKMFVLEEISRDTVGGKKFRRRVQGQEESFIRIVYPHSRRFVDNPDIT